MEYGIWNDDGQLESGFFSYAEAEEALASRYADEDDCYIAEVCTEHEDETAAHCPHCNYEDDSND